MGRQIDSLNDVRMRLHNMILEFRSVEGIISRTAFEQIWDASSNEEKEAAIILIEWGNKEELLDWMKEHPSKELGELPMTRLKQIASKMRVVGYSRMSKRDLLIAITKKEKKNAE